MNDITLFSTPCSCPLVGYGNSWLFFSFPSLTKCMWWSSLFTFMHYDYKRCCKTRIHHTMNKSLWMHSELLSMIILVFQGERTLTSYNYFSPRFTDFSGIWWLLVLMCHMWLKIISHVLEFYPWNFGSYICFLSFDWLKIVQELLQLWDKSNYCFITY